MKIIITGWNGFIGRNVMKKLIDDHECQLIDSDLIDRPSWKNQLDFYVQNKVFLLVHHLLQLISSLYVYLISLKYIYQIDHNLSQSLIFQQKRLTCLSC